MAKKLITMISTEGKTKEEIVAEVAKQLRAKGYLKDEPKKEIKEPKKNES